MDTNKETKMPTILLTQTVCEVFEIAQSESFGEVF